MLAKNIITCVDHHHGQASRTIISGFPAIRGQTMHEKAEYYRQNMSWLHETTLREPRGHRNLLGAVLTDPVSEDAAFGVIFLHPSGTFDGCGDSTFATSAALIEMGMVEAVEPITRFGLDTVLGKLDIEADVVDGVVQEVRFGNIPSYHVGDVDVTLPDGRELRVEIAFGGLYYGFIDAASAGLKLEQKSEPQIISTAQSLWKAIGATTLNTDPVSGKQVSPDLFTFTSKQEAEQGSDYLAANVYKPGRMGRTPSGTGSSAHIALRIAQGAHNPAQPFVQRSLLGTFFTGTATCSTLSNGYPCVLPTIGTKSYMMSISQLVIDPADPFGHGFVMES